MSVIIYTRDPSNPATVFRLPKPEPERPIYNKHVDGAWPDSEEQRAYIKHQRAAYHTNLVRLYWAFEDKIGQHLANRNYDVERVNCETSIDLMAQAEYLYYDRVWNKKPPMTAPDDFLILIYRYWRDVGARQEHRMFDLLWEFVAERKLPREQLTAAHERKPWN